MSPPAARALSTAAFATLVMIALMMGANHVAARFAFNSGVDVVTAVTVRSAATACAVGLLLWAYRVPLKLTPRHRKALPAIGVLVAVQSVCLFRPWRACRWRWHCWPSTPIRCSPHCGRR